MKFCANFVDKKKQKLRIRDTNNSSMITIFSKTINFDLHPIQPHNTPEISVIAFSGKFLQQKRLCTTLKKVCVSSQNLPRLRSQRISALITSNSELISVDQRCFSSDSALYIT